MTTEFRQSTDQKYSPYAVDWRFLPDNILFFKDLARFHLVHVSNNIAESRYLSSVWVNTLGRRILQSINKAKLLFVHIPKTGGTSISKSLYERNLPHYTAEFWRATFGAAVSNYPSFAVVRNPEERLISAYNMARAGGTDIMAYSRYWQAKLRGLETFDAFVDHVFAHRDRLTALPLDLRPQAPFILGGDGAVMVDRLFSLNSRQGMPPELGRWLAIHPIPHLNATRAATVRVSTEARRKIQQIYPIDFEIYEYLDKRGGAADIRGRRIPGLERLWPLPLRGEPGEDQTLPSEPEYPAPRNRANARYRP